VTGIEGVDYAWNGPTAAALVKAGKRFVVRYGGPGSDGKQLHAAELAALRAAGLEVVANAEGAPSGFRGTAAGRDWATSALAHFESLGMPPDRPIYFSVDWDAGSDDWPAIDAALLGAASVVGAQRVGVYGSYDVIAHCVAAGTARWFWQTYAWSHGRTHPADHLYQYRNRVRIDGADCDLNRALTPDYGQWGFQEDDVDDDTIQKIAAAAATTTAKAVWDYRLNITIDANKPASMQPAGGILRYTSAEHARITTALVSANAVLGALTKAAGTDTVDEAAIVAGVLAGLDPAKIAAAIPADMAEQVADILAQRLTA
jgi:hypothetical protein